MTDTKKSKHKKYVPKPTEQKSSSEVLKGHRAETTKRVIESLKQSRDNGVKFRMGLFVSNEHPYNADTERRYNGPNIFGLLSYNYEDPRFLPAGVVARLYGETEGAIRIKKGEKAARVIIWVEAKKELNEDATQVDDGEEINKRLYSKLHPVYNVSQLEGIELINERYPRKTTRVMSQVEESAFIIECVEALKATGLSVEHKAAGHARYYPGRDAIEVPHPDRFESPQMYASTLAHEMGHSTGHKTRCNRDMTGGYGSKNYAYEELVAESFSYYIGMHTGLGYDRSTHESHDAYLNHWLDVLGKDDEESDAYIMKAFEQAFKGFDYVLKQVEELKKTKTEVKEESEASKLVQDISNTVVMKPVAIKPKKAPAMMM